MAWLEFDVYALFRFCGALAALMAVYYLLFDRKARFKPCRYFLLSAVLVSVVAGVVRVPVYVPEQAVVIEFTGFPELSDLSGMARGMEGDSGGGLAVEEEKGMPASRAEAVTEDAIGSLAAGAGAGQEGWRKYAGDSGVWLLAYGVVTVVLMVRWLLAMAGIMRLKRWGSCYEEEGCLVVRNNRVSSPFSFFKMIFVSRKLEGEALEVVVLHERCHIEHRHYVDMLVMELFCIVFWFNPFVWLVRRELRALHEFEVDRCLLSGGLELSKYQHIIFDELMGYGPRIANGFHNSLIKKRFIMMKNTNMVRFRLLRKVALVPVVAGVVALFAFTDRGTVVKQVTVPELPQVAELPELSVLPDTLEAGMLRIEGSAVNDLPELSMSKDEAVTKPLREETTVPVNVPDDDEPVVSGDEQLPKTRAPFKGREGIMFYPLSEDQVVISLLPYRNQSIPRYIDADKDETRVTIAVPIHYDSNWVIFNKGYAMVDRGSGDVYLVRSVTRGIEMNKAVTVEGHKKRMAEFTLVFPPLKKGVKVVDFCMKFPDMGIRSPSNGSVNSWMWKNVRIENYAPPRDYAKYYDKEGRPRLTRKVEYVNLRDDQVVVSPEPYSGQSKLVSIETEGDETRVTVAEPIHFDSNWVMYSKGIRMIDCRTGEVYPIRGLTRGMELNKTLIVNGQKKRMVEFTLVFPALKKKVKRVDLLEAYSEEAALAPANGTSWSWKGVKVADYDRKRGEIIY